MQVAGVKSSGGSEQVDNATPQGPRAPKREAEETDFSRGTGSGKNRAYIQKNSRPGMWTKHSQFGFPIADNTPFIAKESTWDPSWPADKQEYYNARNKVQETGDAKIAVNDAKQTANAAKGATKREPSQAHKIATLKKQLKDLE